MADPMEFNFPEGITGNASESASISSEPAAPNPPMAQASLPHKTDFEMCPEKFTLDAYYQDDLIAKDVLRNKYLGPDEHHPWDLWVRQARAIASVEQTDELRQHWQERFFEVLKDFKFVPGGRIMHGAGREDIKSTLNNCYVVAIKGDSIPDIYQAVIDEAMTYKYGGGCGHDLSVLRPSGDAIAGTGGASCGPVGFMELFSTNTNTIAQHGRRGANMQTLRVDHPDILAFVQVKNSADRVKYSNISVQLTHEFMEAVKSDTDFDLKWAGEVYQTVPARELWDTIIASAHASAEPGLLFWDTMRDYHNGEYCSPLVSTNPCAEQPLPDGGCCNLGSINLERFVDDDGQFLMEPFQDAVQVASRFLDNVIDYNLDRHALDIQRENAIQDRRIGLGILGLGDMFIRMGIKYDAEEALATIDRIMEALRNTAYDTSADLATEKGAFPNFNWGGYSRSKFVQNLPSTIRAKINEQGIRNVTILTVAPTGSGAIVAQVTSGIEPVFATSYTRRVKLNDGFGDEFREYTVYHPVIRNLYGTDRDLPSHVVTSHGIDPYFRVKMQGTIQKYIDSSISSTVNLPGDISESVVADIYMKAYEEGLKGITVYREGSREGILISDIKGDAKDNSEPVPMQDEVSPPLESAPASPAEPSNDRRAYDSGNAAEPGKHQMRQLRPRHRSEETFGVTRRVRTGEGNLYITINEDEYGLCEVFTTIGKAGGLASTQAEAISRLISLALRSGVAATEVVKQLKGISGPIPTWENGRLILSTPDAIGQALDDYLRHSPANKPRQITQTVAENGTGQSAQATSPESAPVSAAPHNGQQEANTSAAKTLTTCPDCGGTVVHESGCITCPGCGYTRC